MGEDNWKERLPNRRVHAPQVVSEQRAGDDRDKPFRGSWLDVLALIIATYQVLALPFLILLGGIGLAVALFFLVFR